jgi:hypothetical protein
MHSWSLAQPFQTPYLQFCHLKTLPVCLFQAPKLIYCFRLPPRHSCHCLAGTYSWINSWANEVKAIPAMATTTKKVTPTLEKGQETCNGEPILSLEHFDVYTSCMPSSLYTLAVWCNTLLVTVVTPINHLHFLCGDKKWGCLTMRNCIMLHFTLWRDIS